MESGAGEPRRVVVRRGPERVRVTGGEPRAEARGATRQRPARAAVVGPQNCARALRRLGAHFVVWAAGPRRRAERAHHEAVVGIDERQGRRIAPETARDRRLLPCAAAIAGSIDDERLAGGRGAGGRGAGGRRATGRRAAADWARLNRPGMVRIEDEDRRCGDLPARSRERSGAPGLAVVRGSKKVRALNGPDAARPHQPGLVDLSIQRRRDVEGGTGRARARRGNCLARSRQHEDGHQDGTPDKDHGEPQGPPEWPSRPRLASPIGAGEVLHRLPSRPRRSICDRASASRSIFARLRLRRYRHRRMWRRGAMALPRANQTRPRPAPDSIPASGRGPAWPARARSVDRGWPLPWPEPRRGRGAPARR